MSESSAARRDTTIGQATFLKCDAFECIATKSQVLRAHRLCGALANSQDAGSNARESLGISVILPRIWIQRPTRPWRPQNAFLY
jgi:hypothetical protein